MNALSPRSPFQVLVMSEESRLGREQIETAYALMQITDASVRVFFYLEDRERTLDNAMDKVMLSLTNFAAEMERERARQRTYDAMLRKAKALHVRRQGLRLQQRRSAGPQQITPASGIPTKSSVLGLGSGVGTALTVVFTSKPTT
ncbi:MAG: hypothetical protein DMD96_35345 [Candidatus Rokuibacteriota bacterium]|nr:MAG: hypothetical protein DMD96_35345 [Candidatus Rokubacteria bacterium]